MIRFHSLIVKDFMVRSRLIFFFLCPRVVPCENIYHVIQLMRSFSHTTLRMDLQ